MLQSAIIEIDYHDPEHRLLLFTDVMHVMTDLHATLIETDPEKTIGGYRVDFFHIATADTFTIKERIADLDMGLKTTVVSTS